MKAEAQDVTNKAPTTKDPIRLWRLISPIGNGPGLISPGRANRLISEMAAAASPTDSGENARAANHQ